MPTSSPSNGLDIGAVLSVSALNRLAREALERTFPLLWVAGEVSNVTYAASGHAYFTLKDESAQVRCAMFRNRVQLLPFRLASGMRVEVQGLVSLYEARGDFQITAESMRRAGAGALYEALIRLRAKLEREGLFDGERKRVIPRFPRAIGVVTSTRAAALRDVLAALRRRAPHLPVIIYPAAVQGEGAPVQLREALGIAAQRRECEVLILTRGGGSLEDLWAFNDEALARAIADCPVPIVCGVGHETDTTLADLAADQRAATPTAAAEIVSAGYFAAASQLAELGLRLRRGMRRRLERNMQRVDLAGRRLASPSERLARLRAELARLRRGLAASIAMSHAGARRTLDHASRRLLVQRPDIERLAHRVDTLRLRAMHAAHGALRKPAARLDTLAARLAHLDPAAPLARGYAIVRDARGRVVRSSAQLAVGESLRAELAEGWVDARVTGRSP